MLRPYGMPAIRSRTTVFLIWQLPTAVMTTVVVIGLVGTGELDHPLRTAVLPLLLIVMASIGLLMLPWENWSPSRRIVIPIVDVVAILLLQLETVAEIPSVSLLNILPLVWLGFEFAWAGVGAAVVGAVVVGVYSYLEKPDPPSGTTEWLDILLLPLVAGVLVLVAQVVSNLLRRNQALLVRQTEQLGEALRASQDQVTVVRAVLETVDTAVWFYDADNRVSMSNSMAGRVAAAGGFHIDEAPYAGDQVRSGDRTTPIPLDGQIVPRALIDDQVSSHLEWWGPKGNQIGLVAGARRVRRDDGSILGTVVAAWDVTELVESLRVREEFLATVSHELRTPLTSIMGYLEVAQDALPSDSPVLATLGIVERNAQTLLDRISHLLVANAGTSADINPVRQEVTSVVSAVVERHRPAAERAHVQMRADLPEGVTGRIDASRFDQVVDNLVSNAIKYTPADGSVDVVLRNQDSGFELNITDTGVGMSDAERTQAFDRFYRSSGARESAAQGFGVGLSIVRDIVRAHGGEVMLYPAPGGGTRAIVSVPHHKIPSEDHPGRPRIWASDKPST
jgi:signal transduction histidine kinase